MPHFARARPTWRPSLLTAALLACLLAPLRASAAGSPADSAAFKLGRVVVEASKTDQPEADESVVAAGEMQQLDLETVDQAVATLPGVNLAQNSRNESLVYLRGFDPRQVPVFLDGIPLYVPYDGYVDFARFTTFDLAEIRVARSAASLLYGPNTLGGAINLVSREPTRPFEGDLSLGTGSGGKHHAAINLGLRQGGWCLQTGWSSLEADGFPLPDGFIDYKRPPTDSGDERENAWYSDRRSSLKIGHVSDSGDEFAIGYARQDGAKGNPVYTGRSTRGIRYWRWPWWDKESLYLIGDVGLGATLDLRLRAWEDRYGNGLEAFTDASYTTPISNRNFPSTYADRSRGASSELIFSHFAGHELHLAAHYKEDRHRAKNPDSPTQDYRDVTTSLAVEDLIALGAQTSLRIGASHEQRDAREVYAWPAGSTHANNALVELVHDLASHGQVFASVAHKTRFPTIKDRYSARMGRALPNPNLKPESAGHLELGWRGEPWSGARLEAVAFHSRIDDLIQDALVPSPACGDEVCDQAQNIGAARSRGLEVSLQQEFAERGQFGLAWTLLDRDNLSDPAQVLTNSPRQRLFGFLQWSLAPRWTFIATAEAERGRMVTYDGPGNANGFLQLDGFAILGATLAWAPHADVEIQFGGHNLGDKWYELAEGYPMPGRSWFVNLDYGF